MRFNSGRAVLSLGLLLATAGSVFAQQITADAIYSGGPILTMDDANPRTEAVAVQDGHIVAVGQIDTVMKLRDAKTRLVNLTGRTMLPGFVDAHGHVMMGGLQALAANMLSPPDGPITDIPGIQSTLSDWVAKNKEIVKAARVIVGFGYDDSQLKERRHPTKEELDVVSQDVPIMLVHQSGHLATMNSVALKLVGYTVESVDPQGGVIRRKPGSLEPSGVVEEAAFFEAAPKIMRNVGPAGMRALAEAGVSLWASFGYTTAQEGRSNEMVSNVFRQAASEGKLKIDVVAYDDVLLGRESAKKFVSRTYSNRFRVGGVKLTIDGSPQGFTAWRDRPYYKPVGDYKPGYSGYAAATGEQVLGALDWAYENNVQIMVHSNGEAASDLLITAIRLAEAKHGKADRRTVLVHGQFQREDQADAFVRLGVIPSLFPMHTFYWGDWHRDHTVGPEAAQNISPVGWYLSRGSIFTTHHDAPVAFPDSMRVLAATVTRRSRSGDIIGPLHRVPVMTALKAMTIWPAYQHFEEATKGSIEPGKLADFVILDKDPTSVDPETLSGLKITETIKEGVTIFAAATGTQKRTGLDGSRFADNPSFGRFLTAMAVERELKLLPANQRTPMMRQMLTLARHDASCVSPVLADLMTEAAGGNAPSQH